MMGAALIAHRNAVEGEPSKQDLAVLGPASTIPTPHPRLALSGGQRVHAGYGPEAHFLAPRR